MSGRLLGLAISVALAGSTPQLRGQSTLSTILGSVRDSSGALVTGANLTVRNIEENTIVTGNSNSEGVFEFLNLKPGRYEVVAKKQGFSNATTGEMWLDARETRRADFTLEVASLTETVAVTARVPLVDTEDGTISDSFYSEQITQLPTNYRAVTTDWSKLIQAIPGVQPDAVGRLSIGGALPAQIVRTGDGSSAGNGTASAEIVSELRVGAAGNSAEVGPLGEISITTKSGANQVHGSALWYHQNDALDATIYGSREKQHKVFNTFGGSFSGPVYIPGVYDGHNHTFFFVDYEGNRKPQSQFDQVLVPTPAMRQGDLNRVSGGDAVDPSSGLPFPGNRIPATMISGVARALLDNYYPLPNLAGADLNWQALTRVGQTTNGYDVRLDQVVGSRHQLFVRWDWRSVTERIDGNPPLPLQKETGLTRGLVASHTFTPKPSISNEFHFGLSRARFELRFPLRGKDVVATLGLQGLDLKNLGDTGGFSWIDFSDGTGFPYVEFGRDQWSKRRAYQSADNLSWIQGRHTMKFGAEGRRTGLREPLYSAFGPAEFGAFMFSSGAFSGNAFADLLLGLPAHSFYSVLGPDVNQFSTDYAFFAKDNWKIGQRLTLELGLRWELHAPAREQSGNVTNFNYATGDVIVPDHTIPVAPGFLAAIHACSIETAPGACTKVLSASDAGLPDSLRRTFHGDWSPRFGFAWRPWRPAKTVLRGSIGIYTMPLLYSNAGVGIHSSDNREYENYQGPGAAPLFTFPNVYPGPSALGTIGVETAVGIDPTLRDPRSYQWNFTLERELPWATSFRASYIGTQSVGMPAGVNFNQVPINQRGAAPPFPFWAGLFSTENLAFSNYQGLQTELSHRLKGGLFFQASYVLSKSISDAGTPRGFFPGEVGVAVTDRFNTRYDRGNQAAARQHRFLLTSFLPLPFGRARALGANWHGITEAVLGGWQLSTVSVVQSGPYQTPRYGGWLGVRPDRIGNGNLVHPTRDHYYDASAFVPVPPNAGRLGTAGVGILEGPGMTAIAAGLSKTFRLTETLRMRMESTFTNLPNHPNFEPPLPFLNNPLFGKLTSVYGGENGGNRVGQVGARLDW
jgi:Carboxypeptidase regulatory-like domain/TonB dependent receptor